MNRLGFLILTFITTIQCVFAEETSPELSSSLKSHSNEPGIMSIIIALLVVICLIYITGLIYSKLNIMGAQTVKKQMKNLDLSSAIVLSTTQLGQGKNLHVIEVDDKRLLIGATPNSINLIKELEIKTEEPKLTVVEPEENFDVHKKYL